MKFSLYSSNLSDRFRETKNPFTGNVVKNYLDKGLTEFQLASVRKYLKSIGAYETENTEFVHVPLNGNNILKIRAYGLLSGHNPRTYGLEWNNLSPEVAEIIYSIGIKGCMALRYELGPYYIFNGHMAGSAAKRWNNIERIENAENLYKRLQCYE
ncbi:MAG: hypothetical protein P8Y45_01805 [Exilibacterium sp.]